MVMNKSLQIYTLRKMLSRNGIDPDLIDLEAEIDSTLTLEENAKLLASKLGIPLTKAMEEIRKSKMEDEYISQKSDELLETILHMNGVDELDLDEESNIDILAEELKAHQEQLNEIFTEIVNTSDPLETFSRYLFPEIVGEQYDDVRKAVLLMLATQRDMRKRTRIHVLLVGAPGSGKTEILLWLNRKLNAYFINAEHASKVGLAGDARGKEITPGALNEAHGMVMCIDELDKMSYKDQSALLQAMEEGQYTIVKGKFRERLKAEVRVIAAANEIEKIQKPLLDRFDFVFVLNTPTKRERAENVGKLIEEFFGMMDNKPNEDILTEYLSWIQGFEPGVTDIDRVKEVMKSYINLTNDDLTEKSYRSLELSILRVAYALAKLEKKDMSPEHVVKAIRLKDRTLTSDQLRYLTAIARGLLQ